MQKIWFCSDYHFNHKGALNFRKQFSSVEEMNDKIIDIHNNFVAPTDVVYHLGDFIWKGKPQEFLERLNGYFYIIKGNHDRETKFEMKNKVMHVIDGYYNIKIQNQDITLCHFPMISWNRSHWGAWHLYGHHHSPLPYVLQLGKTLNVNFDVIGRPVSFEDVSEIMKDKSNNWDHMEKRNA